MKNDMMRKRYGMTLLMALAAMAVVRLMPVAAAEESVVKWDVIHFNWGVWDLAYRNPASTNFGHLDKVDGKLTTSLDQYGKNLEKLVVRMKETGATLIWASTTAVPEGEPGRIKGDSEKYNEAAAGIMKKQGVIIDDLYAESVRQGFPKTANIHSVGKLDAKVVETILTALASRKENSKPLPRVLLIGDSITGTYQKQVIKSLEGKARVFMIWENGEHTGTGLAKIDRWLDPEEYLPDAGEKRKEAKKRKK
jgi:hypothetical protein